jgi:ornithine cyclodeaminase/alanine dehydrogenase-like protein (mu-crystallin family)
MSTPLRIIDGATVRRLAPPEKLIAWMQHAMVSTSRRAVELPLRRGMVLPGGLGVIGMMPGYVGEDTASAGVKLVSLVPPERRRGSSHLGLMVLYDADGLIPQAIVCGATVTALRTAAVSALATSVLARPEASVLAILGAGEQAAAHIPALMAVRRFKKIVIWARRREQADALAASLQVPAELVVASSVQEAVAAADVVCTLTSAREPILQGEWLAPGAHINLVGSSSADAREADDAVVQRSRFFVDYIPSTLDQAGELLHAKNAGLVDDSHIVAELGAVLEGTAEGRRNAEEITVYKSLGIAAQDVVTAREVYRAACAANLGVMAAV